MPRFPQHVLNGAHLGVVFAVFVLSVVACSGEDSALIVTPSPTRITEALPTPTPTPTPTPSPTPVPEPSPFDITACSNGVAVLDPGNNPDLVRDCAILLGARDILAPQPGYDLDWSPNLFIATWRGIRVTGGRVRVIDLESYEVHAGDVVYRVGLGGTIPPSLGGLTGLRSLRLQWNHLGGHIPSSLGNLTQLESLDLCGNHLIGEIPSSLGNLTSMKILRLNNNQLTGEIPSSLGNLTSLWQLELYGNQLTGEIPASLGNLTSLWELDLAYNQLTGEIPSSLTNLYSLKRLVLSPNELSGCVPAELRRVEWDDLAELGLPFC